jgi:hypothetical protein
MSNASVATYAGRSILWNRMKGAGAEAKNLQWGDSAVTGSASANVNLFKPQTEARTAGASSLITTTQLADTYQVVGTITCAGAGKTITEVGLFDTTTASTTTTLTASITASATSVTFAANPGPTSGNYYVQIENETLLVTGAASTTLTATRGALGSTAAIHASAVPATLGGDGGAGTGGATSGQTATVGAAQGGNCFIHADFAGIALNINDSVAFTISDTLT